ncbi:MAG: HAD family phosphatase [Roseibium sp.]|uniref:HAD family hydrolase n=1 Tax=Roseibium sp. TaxID=1936156 RepID=UPI003D9C2CCC
MTPGLVIFDCDGVLVDTERLTNRTLAALLTECGFPISGPACQKRFMGRTLEAVQEIVERELGRNLPSDWLKQLRARDIESFKAGVEQVPGVADVMDLLDERGIPYCVGSSGKYEKMHSTLGSAGLLPRLIDKLYSSQDCERGKPAPDIFLLAAKSMGHRPQDCVVIEDSLPGVKAARAAGMRVFAYVQDPVCDREALRAAGAILFERMDQLPDLLFGNA